MAIATADLGQDLPRRWMPVRTETWLRWTDQFGLPPWTVPLAACLLVIIVSAGTWLMARSAWRSHHRAVARAHANTAPAAVSWLLAHRTVVGVGAAGMAVSMHGLYGFARDVLLLPIPLAVGFVTILDGATAALIFLLYGLVKNNPGKWTAQMQETRRGARFMVVLSAAANFYEAPPQSGLVGAIFLALVPIIAAWMTERNLAAHRIAALAGAREDDHARPGPLRLIAVAWHSFWARVFALLGLDAAATTGEMARAALAQRAADCLDQYRAAVQRTAERPAARRRRARADERRLAALKERATAALDRADVATDQAQALAVAQRMATRTQVPALAVLDWADATAVVDQLERIAVQPAARRLAAEMSTAEAQHRRDKAVAEREHAEKLTQAARDEAERAAEAAKQSEAERQEAEQRAAAAREEADEACRVRDVADAERRRAAQAAADSEAHTEEQLRVLAGLMTELEAKAAERQRAEDDLAQLGTARQRAEEETQRLRQRADALEQEVQQSIAERGRLAGEAAALDGRVGALRTELKDGEDIRADRQRAIQDAESLLQEAQRRAGEAVTRQQTAENRIKELMRHQNELEAAVEVLQGRVRTLAPVPDEVTVSIDQWTWDSPSKQAAWKLFLEEIGKGTVRPASSLIYARMEAEGLLGSTGPDRVRSWCSEFRKTLVKLKTSEVADRAPALAG